MEEYIKVNVTNYVNNGIENGTMTPKIAEKYTRIMAVQGNVGDEVISWSMDSNGNEVKEKVASVTLDSQTNEPGWIATKLDEEGKPVIDKNGHLNKWIINDSTFKKKYESDIANPGLFKPTGGPQAFVEINDNIILEQWGREMKIAKGGFINITNPEDMYGISKQDFEDTYKFIENSRER